MGGLVDKETIKANQVLLVCTTGGGGWGDPIERAMDSVLLDVVQNKVSKLIARDEYGVVIVDTEDGLNIDKKATSILREKLRKKGNKSGKMIDRGSGMSLFEVMP